MKNKPAAINLIWLWLILLAVLFGMANGSMEAVTGASFDSAKSAVTLAFKLIGVMALWLGLMKVAEAGGLMRLVARAIRPVMVRLFPDVPAEHPAMAAMIMNMAANMLGLGNAATPMGIKAMIELDRLNPAKGRATNAMCLFLAINTSSVTVLPLGVIGVRAAAGSSDPAAILIPSLIATSISTAVAIISAKLLAGRALRNEKISEKGAAPGRAETPENGSVSHATPEEGADDGKLIPPGIAGRSLMIAVLAAAAGIFIYRLAVAESAGMLGDEIMRHWVVPLIMLAILVFGYLRGVKVYEAATEGAKEGFEVAVRIIPFLVVILVAIGMFKASGAFAVLSGLLSPLTETLGLPADVIPMALMRPLSGSGAFGVMSEIVANAPDSLSAHMAGIMQGSTETTFYVMAVYFGAVGVTKLRYAVAAALLADAAGIVASIALAHLTYVA